jgi:hypothetical protein
MMQEGQTVLLQVNTAAPLAAAIRRAADRDYRTVSDFVRQALLEKLRALGIEPSCDLEQNAR